MVGDEEKSATPRVQEMKDLIVQQAGSLVLAWALVFGQLAERKENMLRLDPAILVLAPFQTGTVTVTCRPPPDDLGQRYSRFVIDRQTVATAMRRSVLVDCRRRGGDCVGSVGKTTATDSVQGGVEDGFVRVTLVKIRTKDRGTYRCATFSASKIYHQNTEFVIQEMTSFAEHTSADVTESVNITCNATFYWPGPKVTWKWEMKRGGLWEPFVQLGSASRVTSSSTFNSADSTQFYLTSLVTHLTSDFTGVSYRCRLLLNNTDAGRLIDTFNLAWSRAKVRKSRQTDIMPENTTQGEDQVGRNPSSEDNESLVLLLGMIALALVVILVIVLFFIYRRMAKAEHAKQRRKALIRARAAEASARLREEPYESETNEGSHAGSAKGSDASRVPKVSVHFSDSDTVWDPKAAVRVYRQRRKFSRQETPGEDTSSLRNDGSRESNEQKEVGRYGKRRTVRDIANEYRARKISPTSVRAYSPGSARRLTVDVAGGYGPQTSQDYGVAERQRGYGPQGRFQHPDGGRRLYAPHRSSRGGTDPQGVVSLASVTLGESDQEASKISTASEVSHASSFVSELASEFSETDSDNDETTSSFSEDTRSDTSNNATKAPQLSTETDRDSAVTTIIQEQNVGSAVDEPGTVDDM